MPVKLFQVDVTFELVDNTNRWATYKVTDSRRGQLGFFRINKEELFCDERDEEGELMLSEFWSGQFTTEEFMQRFELLNWIYQVFEGFAEEGIFPPYHFVSM